MASSDEWQTCSENEGDEDEQVEAGEDVDEDGDDAMLAGHPPYEYSPLRASTTATTYMRVLTLAPGDWDEPLAGQLEEVPFTSSGGTYAALSYCWGDASTRRYLFIGGAAIPIGWNLYEALRRLRDRQKYPRIWADAICINQRDVQERTEQVAAMGAIYGRSRCTLVWLGEEFDGSEGPLCMDFFCKRPYLERSLTRSLIDVYNTVTQQERPGAQKLNIGMLRRFAERPWFTRRWVLQEIMNASDGRVLLGSLECSWNQLRAAFSEFRSLHKGILRLCEDVATNAAETSSATTPDASAGTRKLVHYLRLFDELQCKDPRDRIAAFLGLRGLHIRSLFKIQYGLSKEENYIEFANFLFDQGYYVQVLQDAVDRRDPDRPHPSLPSFVPDWEHTASPYRNFEYPTPMQKPPYKLIRNKHGVSLQISCNITALSSTFTSRIQTQSMGWLSVELPKVLDKDFYGSVLVPVDNERIPIVAKYNQYDYHICWFHYDGPFFLLEPVVKDGDVMRVVAELKVKEPEQLVPKTLQPQNHVPIDTPMSRPTSRTFFELPFRRVREAMQRREIFLV